MSIKLPKIQLDSGNPEDTKRIKSLLGFLDGQTTNPSLVVKNPAVSKFIESGKKLTEEELLKMYKEIVQQVATHVAGPISIETYSDWDTKAEEMLEQARDMKTWTRNSYIKFPTTPEGLKAAHQFVKEGGKVNMTLVFDHHQAAAVYSATFDEENKGPHFVSPFVGRWDDRGFNGMDIVENIIRTYRNFSKETGGKSHVEVLAASIRNLDHFYASIVAGADILTVPSNVLEEWVEAEQWVPDERYRYDAKGLKKIPYTELTFSPDWSQYNVGREPGSLLDEGLIKFAKDWNQLLQK